jgi:hypothetical protein
MMNGHRNLRGLAWAATGLVVVGWQMTGCQGDEGGESDKIASLVSTVPSNGGTIASNGVLTLTFDHPSGEVTVNGTAAVVQGSTATWTVRTCLPGRCRC